MGTIGAGRLCAIFSSAISFMQTLNFLNYFDITREGGRAGRGDELKLNSAYSTRICEMKNKTSVALGSSLLGKFLRAS